MVNDLLNGLLGGGKGKDGEDHTLFLLALLLFLGYAFLRWRQQQRQQAALQAAMPGEQPPPYPEGAEGPAL